MNTESETHAELSEAVQIPLGDVTDQDHLKELVRAANGAPEETWDTLSDPTQLWVNVSAFCIEKDRELPDFDDKTLIKKLKAEMDSADAEAERKEKAKKAAKPNGAKKPKADTAGTKKAAAKKKEEPVSKAKVAKKKEEPVSKAKGKTTAAKDARGRKGSYPLTAKITLKAKENPHRPGCLNHKMYAKYKSGMTVQQALDAGIVWANMRYLSGLGHIKVG